MRAATGVLSVLAGRGGALWVLQLAFAAAPGATAQVRAQRWVEPLTALRAAPVALESSSAPLAERIAAARALGRYGPERDAVTALLAALESEPQAALRDELLRSLARRASAAARPSLLKRLQAKGPKPPELGLALAAVGDDEVARALVKALERAEDTALARATLLGMGERAAPVLGEALSGPRAGDAAELLRELGAAAGAARTSLEQALERGDAALAARAAQALEALGDPRSAAALSRRAREPWDEASSAALAALVACATPAEAPLLAKLATTGEPVRRALALRALAHAQPTRAAPLLAGALDASVAALHDAARAALLADTPDASFIAALSKLARAGDEAAASALARVPAGQGVAALLALARADSEHAARCARPLALALRHFRSELDDALVDQALASLRALPSSPRRTLLLALARDPRAAEGLAKARASAHADERAAAASALTLAPGAAAAEVTASAPAVVSALEREPDAEVRRRLCDAARTLGARPSARTLDRLLSDPTTAPEALALWASLERKHPSRGLRVALRRALDPRSAPCLRAAAARALGEQSADGDSTAEVPLVTLLTDPVPHLRLAAIHALRPSTSARATSALAQHQRVERDAHVRSATEPDAAHDRAVPDHALELRLRSDDDVPRLLEVWLDDGRCLRQRTLAGGELVIADLPAGEADVRVID